MANTTVTSTSWLTGPLRPYWARFWLLIQLQVVRRARSYGLVVALDVVVVTAAYESATIMRFADDISAVIAQVKNLFFACLLAGALYASVSYLLGLHRRLWHFASLRDGYALIQAVGIATVLIGAIDLAGLAPLRLGLGAARGRALPLSVVIGGACLSFLFLGAAKVLPKVAFGRQPVAPAGTARVTTRVLIIGAGQAGASLAARFLLNSGQGYHVD
jgi:FlaA1/EpsC-like NDP-sugar epimerase